MDNYWIKKGEANTVHTHLDNDMDEYWKREGKNVVANVNENESTMNMTKLNSVENSYIQ